jgi:hypothetical protein
MVTPKQIYQKVMRGLDVQRAKGCVFLYSCWVYEARWDMGQPDPMLNSSDIMVYTCIHYIYIPRPPSGTDKCVLLGVWYAFLWNGQILKTNLISNTFFKGTIWTCLSKLSGFVWFWPALHVSICFYFLPCPSNFCSNISSMINRDVHACSNAWGLASLKMHFLSAFLQCGNWVHDVNDSCRVLTSD